MYYSKHKLTVPTINSEGALTAFLLKLTGGSVRFVNVHGARALRARVPYYSNECINVIVATLSNKSIRFDSDILKVLADTLPGRASKDALLRLHNSAAQVFNRAVYDGIITPDEAFASVREDALFIGSAGYNDLGKFLIQTRPELMLSLVSRNWHVGELLLVLDTTPPDVRRRVFNENKFEDYEHCMLISRLIGNNTLKREEDRELIVEQMDWLCNHSSRKLLYENSNLFTKLLSDPAFTITVTLKKTKEEQ